MSYEAGSMTERDGPRVGDALAEVGGKPEKLFKIAFDLPEETASWTPGSVELLWAAKTSVKMEAQVRNTPFYVKGVSFGDTVRVRVDHERRELVFESFVAASGHSTIRIFVKDGDSEELAGSLLRNFDCPWEIDSTGYLWAVDVPPGADYPSLRAELVRLVHAGRIEVEEATLSEAHREPSELDLSD